MKMLRVIRERKNITATDLAFDVKCNYSCLNRYELSKKGLAKYKLEQIAEYLESTVDEIDKEITREEYEELSKKHTPRNIRNYRQKKKLSIKQLEKLSGVNEEIIFKFEAGFFVKPKYVSLLAKALKTTKVEISKPLEEYEEFDKKIESKLYNTPCLNQQCPLCKDCICINDVVLEGRGTCASKDKISAKPKKFGINNAILLADNNERGNIYDR